MGKPKNAKPAPAAVCEPPAEAQKQSLNDYLGAMGAGVSQGALVPAAKTDKEKLEAHGDAVQTLARFAHRDWQNFDPTTLHQFAAAVVAGLVNMINAIKSAIIASPAFRELERAHASVETRVNQKDGAGLKVRVLNLTKADIVEDFAEAGSVGSSHLQSSLIDNEFHRPGGQPNRVVNFLDPVSADDVPLLRQLLGMAEEAHFVLLAQTKPSVVCPRDDQGQEPDSFRTLPRTAEGIEAQYQNPDNAPLHGLQEEGISSRLLLGVGRPIGRRPYDAVKNPAPGTSKFNESNRPLYLGANLLAAMSIARSYSRSGFGSRIAGCENGGKHTLQTVIEDGEVMTQDVVINEKQEMALQRCGLYGALQWKGKDYSVSFAVPSAYRPGQHDDEQEAANAELAARLAYVTLGNEFGQKLKKQLRYARGKAMNSAKMAKLIEKKLKLYVTPDLESADEETLARKPLAAVTVEVTMPKPGRFVAVANITPHLMLEGVQVTLKLRAEVSDKKK